MCGKAHCSTFCGTFHQVRHAPTIPFMLELLPIFAHLTLMAIWCSEPLIGLTILKSLASIVFSSTRLEPSLSYSVVFTALARLTPIAAVRSPLRRIPLWWGTTLALAWRQARPQERGRLLEGQTQPSVRRGRGLIAHSWPLTFSNGLRWTVHGSSFLPRG